MFVDRESEIQSLLERMTSNKAEFLVVYGRRRIGKTELLRKAFAKGTAIYFVADLGADRDQRRRFSEAVNLSHPSPLLQADIPPGWDSLFRYVITLAERDRIVLVLDEFPYLCSSDTALPSVLQRIWDEVGKDSKLYLVLCGSFISFMEREVLGHKSPLYGRRTGQLLVHPLSLRTLKGFLPGYSPEERILTYAILGGVPAYLIQFSDKLSIRQNIEKQVLKPTAFLHDEVRFILMEELRDPKHYLSVLQSIAFGNTRMNDIVQRTGIERGPASKYLSVLQDLRVIERETPVTEKHPEKSRKGIYRLSDNFFRFWFRFVLPYKSRLVEGGERKVLEGEILPYLDNFIGQVFDKIGVEILRYIVDEGKIKLSYDRAGRWWNGNEEIDLVAVAGDEPVFAAECKWSKKPVGIDILKELRRKASLISSEGARDNLRLGLFSRSGFSKEIEALGRKGEIELIDVRKTGL
ncbi:MAG: ATP-binding protein [Armatimonadetes bacterium]|nr:ATP-binding protein [Armatimonadota bacterium]